MPFFDQLKQEEKDYPASIRLKQDITPFFTLGKDSEGNLYAIAQDGTLYPIQLDDDVAELIGLMGSDDAHTILPEVIESPEFQQILVDTIHSSDNGNNGHLHQWGQGHDTEHGNGHENDDIITNVWGGPHTQQPQHIDMSEDSEASPELLQFLSDLESETVEEVEDDD